MIKHHSCDLEKLISPVKKISLADGREILGITKDFGTIDSKADGSPVTLADRLSHDTIFSALSSLTPDIPIISEEGDPSYENVKSASLSTYWLVDPLDGTKEFIKGLGEYTVNIALIERARPILGVIHAPTKEVIYWAADKMGAWKKESTGKITPLHGRGTRNPITAIISRSHPSPKTEVFLDRLKVKRIIRHGSSLKICAVAEGAADIYPRF